MKLRKSNKDHKVHKQSRVTIDWGPTLFLSLTPLASILLGWYYFTRSDWNWTLIGLAVFFYAATALSITGGYHRLFAHKSYQAHPIVKWTYALFGAAAFQNSILKWATDHRIHHQFVDTDKDPYSISKGFWYAHLGWMLLKEPQLPNWKSYARDLIQDPVVMFQDRFYIPLAVGMGLVLPTLLGGWCAGTYLGGFVVVGLIRMVALHHGTFCINSLCHWWGSQKFTDINSARDNFVAALLTFGEGYHNFHHFFANDYRNGIKWYHWDPTKWLIAIKARLGLASQLKTTPELEILKAKLTMQTKTIKARASRISFQWSPSLQNRIEELKDQLLRSHARALNIQAQIRAARASGLPHWHQRMQSLKTEWIKAKRDCRNLWKQWRLTVILPPN